MNLLGEAIKTAQRGFHIFPVEPGGKTPHKIKPDKPYTIRWSEAATTDVAKIVSWWTYSPEANIGIACKPSGLLVFDSDQPKREYQLAGTPWAFLHDKYGPLVDGTDALREMCEQYGDNWDRLMRTYRVCTGSMGLHTYLRWPAWVQASQASPVPGLLDTRGNGGEKGGYVLGAGSLTEKGPYVAENALGIADAPPWAVELCKERPKAKPLRDVYSQPGNANYSGLVESVRLAVEGNRNNVLLWAARSMCEDGATEEEANEVLVQAATQAGLFQRDAEATVRSAYRLQRGKS
jgi:hypothetical protein